MKKNNQDKKEKIENALSFLRESISEGNYLAKTDLNDFKLYKITQIDKTNNTIILDTIYNPRFRYSVYLLQNTKTEEKKWLQSGPDGRLYSLGTLPEVELPEYSEIGEAIDEENWDLKNGELERNESIEILVSGLSIPRLADEIEANNFVEINDDVINNNEEITKSYVEEEINQLASKIGMDHPLNIGDVGSYGAEGVIDVFVAVKTYINCVKTE